MAWIRLQSGYFTAAGMNQATWTTGDVSFVQPQDIVEITLMPAKDGIPAHCYVQLRHDPTTFVRLRELPDELIDRIAQAMKAPSTVTIY